MKPKLIDTIEYKSDAGKLVRITLTQINKNLFNVTVITNGQAASRGFASEAQANTYICNVQAGNA